MRLTVLGNAGRYLAPWSAGSGYLLEHGDAALLLDCGPGVRAAPALHEAAARVKGVLVTHTHFDHVLDLVPVLKEVPQARVFTGPGGRRALDALGRAYRFEGPFDHAGGLEELDGGWRREVGPFRVRTAWTKHAAPSVAYRVEAGGKALVYAGDTAACFGLLQLAAGCDVLLAHTLLPRVDPDAEHARIHLTAETAAALAKRAGAARLWLSHRYHEEKDEVFLAAAKARFDGETRLLRDGEVVEV